MKRSVRLLVLAAVFGISESAFGQLALVDQSRSLATAGNSDSSAASGTYSKSLTYDPSGSYSDGNGTYSVTSGAMQTSVVSPSVLSGTSSVNAVTVVTAGQTGSPDTDDTTSDAQSIYNVDFSVASPTPFILTRSISGGADYILGRLPTTSANVTLSSSSQGTPLYSVSEDYGDGPGLTFYGPDGNADYNDPVQFTTILEPGQTYTLNAEAYVYSIRYNDAEGNEYDPATAAFSFTAAVPEPISLALVLPAIVLMKRSRRRLTTSQTAN